MTIQDVQQLTKYLPFFFPASLRAHHIIQKKKKQCNCLGSQLGQVQSHQQMHVYVVAFHPEVMSHVPCRCECRHISDYLTCKLSRAVLTPFLSCDFFFFFFTPSRARMQQTDKLGTGFKIQDSSNFAEFSFFLKVLQVTYL